MGEPKDNLNKFLLQQAIHVLRKDCLEEGIPQQWTESDGYIIDMSEEPEHWAFPDIDETFRVYSSGDLERFDDQPMTLEDLQNTAIVVLSALQKAYEVQIAIAAKKN